MDDTSDDLWICRSGDYTLRLTPRGSGYAEWRGMALYRWSADPLAADEGWAFFLRESDTGRFWQTGTAPALKSTAVAPDSVWRRQQQFDTLVVELTAQIAEHAAGEHRQVRLRNDGPSELQLELYAYLEPVLQERIADLVHPAFSKLFVQTAWDDDRQVLLATRRPRAQDQPAPWLALGVAARCAAALDYATDRKRFVGRGRRLREAVTLAQPGGLPCSVGNVLDAIFALRLPLVLGAGETVSVDYLLTAEFSRHGALAQVERWRTGLTAPPLALSMVVNTGAADAPTGAPSAPPEPMVQWNGYGGFSADGREYLIRLLPQPDGRLRLPPMPWANVLANEYFGCVISETGAGVTWSRNSREWRLSPWYNDPVSDPHGEALYLRDEVSGAVWSPLPGPCAVHGEYLCRHGFGYSEFRHISHGLEQRVWVCVDRHAPVKLVSITLRDLTGQARHLAVYSYQRLVLGVLPEQTAAHIVTGYAAELSALTAENPHAGPFTGGLTFAAWISAEPMELSYTADRASFLGADGDVAKPRAVALGGALDGAVGCGLQPCFALRTVVHLDGGASYDGTSVFGECQGVAAIRELLAQLRQPGEVARRCQQVVQFWRDTFQPVQLNIGVPAIDFMVNGWLPYQILSCRLWARTAYYQSGGAYGFRDQLQDAAALVYLRPDLTRQQLILHAGHQFVEGDVLHWWHPEPMEQGIRTRFSDDLLWLPYLAAFYVGVTGDAAVLHESAPFLAARLLLPGEDEALLQPVWSGQSADLYEHCCRALDRSLTTGIHGLPLMGTGDWNDGMNRVGREGRGESVWVGFFLYRILADFLPFCIERNDTARIGRYQTYRSALRSALNDSGWDGEWYRRAYYDDGTPLGSSTSDECQIDALAQAWAVISGAAPRQRAEQAVEAVEQRLIAEDVGIIRLLTPPFVETPHDPGYIRGYLAGIRENGGQYTHAALWVVQAMARLGREERAMQLLEMLSPVAHGSAERIERYQVEPYVIAADIYGAEPHVGRGGWSWYTGSAGWFYRIASELTGAVATHACNTVDESAADN